MNRSDAQRLRDVEPDELTLEEREAARRRNDLADDVFAYAADDGLDAMLDAESPEENDADPRPGDTTGWARVAQPDITYRQRGGGSRPRGRRRKKVGSAGRPTIEDGYPREAKARLSDADAATNAKIRSAGGNFSELTRELLRAVETGDTLSLDTRVMQLHTRIASTVVQLGQEIE